MAKILETMPKKVSGKRTATYPYDEWFDGRARGLEAGVDFKSKPASLGNLLRTEAAKRGLKVQVYIQGTDVFVQATKPAESAVEAPKPTPARRGTK